MSRQDSSDVYLGVVLTGCSVSPVIETERVVRFPYTKHLWPSQARGLSVTW